MEVVTQAEPLSMSWCLDCHRNPEPHLRPTEEVTNMEWFPSKNHADVRAERVIEEKRIRTRRSTARGVIDEPQRSGVLEEAWSSWPGTRSALRRSSEREFPEERLGTTRRCITASNHADAARVRRASMAGLAGLPPAGGEDRSLRERARGVDSRRAAVFRDHDADGSTVRTASSWKATRAGRPRSRATSSTRRRWGLNEFPRSRPRSSTCTTRIGRSRSARRVRKRRPGPTGRERLGCDWSRRLTSRTQGARAWPSSSEPFSSPTTGPAWPRRSEAAFPAGASGTSYDPISDENIYDGNRPGVRCAVPSSRSTTSSGPRSSWPWIRRLPAHRQRGRAPRPGLRRFAPPGRPPNDSMSRLYVVESGLSLTGGNADHRLRLRQRQDRVLLLATAGRRRWPPGTPGLGLLGAGAAVRRLRSGGPRRGSRPWPRDLLANRSRGRSLIVAGRRQPPAVHAAVLALNAALGNLGQTVTLHEIARRRAMSRSADLHGASIDRR